ncbi:MAG: class I SAM-dependent methyltransferase [Acidimicrobiales bacterium]
MTAAANDRHWFEALAEHMGPAYLRYSFTKGTRQEVASLVELLGLEPGQRVLDVGCGPGRHSLALAELGFDVVGVDIAERFVRLANEAAVSSGLDERATFTVADARALPFDGEFDAVISLCQGAFGLAGGAGAHLELPRRELDEPILDGIARALRPGGVAAISAFSAYFQIRFLEAFDTFDAVTGVNHETTEVRDPDGRAMPADLWTTCFTPRELRLLARAVGLEPVAIHGVTPGAYGPHDASTDCPEFLLLARRGQPDR